MVPEQMNSDEPNYVLSQGWGHSISQANTEQCLQIPLASAIPPALRHSSPAQLSNPTGLHSGSTRWLPLDRTQGPQSEISLSTSERVPHRKVIEKHNTKQKLASMSKPICNPRTFPTIYQLSTCHLKKMLLAPKMLVNQKKWILLFQFS